MGKIHLVWEGAREESQSHPSPVLSPSQPVLCEPEPVCMFSLQWEKLQMTASERRKIMCSVTFHIIAITCVVWSLYVLIDRTAEEIKQGQATGMCPELMGPPAQIAWIAHGSQE